MNFILLRSAVSFIQQHVSPLLPHHHSSSHHHMIGRTIVVNNIKVKLRSLIAEGGFGYVFVAEDSKGNLYALKSIIAADKEASNAALREIMFNKELSGAASIVKFIAAATRPACHRHPAEFVLLTELCTGGTLLDYLKRGDIKPDNVLKIFYSVSAAVKHMHDRKKPITHRDIKIENLLFTSEGYVKLCDFGSATTEIWHLDETWNASQRSLLEEELQKHSTPMYRAPETLNTYQNFPIGPAQDLWALGCILFYLCYRVHPFEDSSKLRIVNAKYVLPSDDETHYAVFHPIIRSLLQPNPNYRPSIQFLCNQLELLADKLKIDLSKPVSLEEKSMELVPLSIVENDSQESQLPDVLPTVIETKLIVDLDESFVCENASGSTQKMPQSHHMPEASDHIFSKPVFQKKQASTNYNTSTGLPTMDQRTAPPPKPDDIFAELLADQGFAPDMKKGPMVKKVQAEKPPTLDPVSIKINNWTKNKNGNIRNLLSSLDEVLWPEAGTWIAPSLIEMIDDRNVKKVYHRACLLVHPDKLMDTPHYSLATAIVSELTLAMKAFEDNTKLDLSWF